MMFFKIKMIKMLTDKRIFREHRHINVKSIMRRLSLFQFLQDSLPTVVEVKHLKSYIEARLRNAKQCHEKDVPAQGNIRGYTY
jgi:hypothetical protein